MLMPGFTSAPVLQTLTEIPNFSPSCNSLATHGQRCQNQHIAARVLADLERPFKLHRRLTEAAICENGGFATPQRPAHNVTLNGKTSHSGLPLRSDASTVRRLDSMNSSLSPVVMLPVSGNSNVVNQQSAVLLAVATNRYCCSCAARFASIRSNEMPDGQRFAMHSHRILPIGICVNISSPP